MLITSLTLIIRLKKRLIRILIITAVITLKDINITIIKDINNCYTAEVDESKESV